MGPSPTCTRSWDSHTGQSPSTIRGDMELCFGLAGKTFRPFARLKSRGRLFQMAVMASRRSADARAHIICYICVYGSLAARGSDDRRV